MTYKALVDHRKNYKLAIDGLINPSHVEETKLFDAGCYLEPWAKWHNSIPADIMVVGQDWGGKKYYLDNNGYDNDENPTCKNLITLFKELGIPIGNPNKPDKSRSLHFTNIIPFLRSGKMQGELNKILNQEKINEFAKEFIKPLIEIVTPKIIITLGLSSYRGIMSIYNQATNKTIKLKDLVINEPIELRRDLLLFPMYHCGSSGVNRNRNLTEQKGDWSKIRAYL